MGSRRILQVAHHHSGRTHPRLLQEFGDNCTRKRRHSDNVIKWGSDSGRLTKLRCLVVCMFCFQYLLQQEGHHMCERTCSDVCTMTLEVREIDLNVKRALVQPPLMTKTI